MKEMGGKFLLICAMSMLVMEPWRTAVCQEQGGALNGAPVMTPPPASKTGLMTSQTPIPQQSPPPQSPLAPATPAPALRGSYPMLTGTTPALTGTAPIISGTGVVTSGTAPSPSPPLEYSIEIDLTHQHVYLLKDGHAFADAPVSSGRAGHLTPTGDFFLIQKDLNHFSNLYGKIVEIKSGRLVKNGADVAKPVPKGCKFVPAPMKWFMRFEGASGMHAGILPGYPASHGCVRMPPAKAKLFFETVSLGTPVHVFGTPPLRTSHEEEPRHHAAAPPQPTPAPAPTPRAKRGWWIFQGRPRV